MTLLAGKGNCKMSFHEALETLFPISLCDVMSTNLRCKPVSGWHHPHHSPSLICSSLNTGRHSFVSTSDTNWGSMPGGNIHMFTEERIIASCSAQAKYLHCWFNFFHQFHYKPILKMNKPVMCDLFFFHNDLNLKKNGWWINKALSL